MITDSQRVRLTKHWLEGAQQLASASQINLVHKCWQTISSCGLVVSLGTSNGSSLSGQQTRVLLDLNPATSKRHHLPIWLATKNDVEVLKIIGAGRSYSDNWSAFYNFSRNLIVLKKDYGASNREKAVALLHETGHAMFAIVEGRFGNADAYTSIQEIREESLLHYMEAQLWKEWGGVVYNDLLSETVRILEKQLTPEMIWGSLPDNADWLVVLANFLGPTQSTKHSIERKDRLKRFSHFEYFDRKYDKRRARAYRGVLMKRIYDLLQIKY